MSGPGSAGGGDRLAWFDVSAGVAGDMLCGALVDVGVPVAVLQSAIDAVVPGAVRWSESVVARGGLRAVQVQPERLEEGSPDRGWARIRSLLEAAALSDRVRRSAIDVFAALAEAEARVHGVAAEEVHFHEVGGVDAIADIIGVCAGLDHLDVEVVSAGPLALGAGRIGSAHGALPIPVPAVVELCAGWEVLAGGAGELATPTGTALVTTLADSCEPLPAMVLQTSGVGAGSRDTVGQANVVRVLVGTASTGVGVGSGRPEVVLEANVDDLDPRLWPSVLAALLAAGASDAWLQPIVMKKGRPAHTLSVLAPPGRVAALRGIVFAWTSTIGFRTYPVTKHALDRVRRDIEVEGQVIAVKVAHDQGRVVHATPEFDDVAAAARALDRPARAVLEAATAAVVAAGFVAGAALSSPPAQPRR